MYNVYTRTSTYTQLTHTYEQLSHTTNTYDVHVLYLHPRWKPPPPRMSPDDPHIGWRTEFRSMEVQLTGKNNIVCVFLCMSFMCVLV